MKWAHLPFLFLFSRVTVRSQSKRLGRQPIPLRWEFRSECVGYEAVCLLAPAPSAAPLHPHLPRSSQTLLIRPLDFCLQGSQGGSVALCVTLGLTDREIGLRGPRDWGSRGRDLDSGFSVLHPGLHWPKTAGSLLAGNCSPWACGSRQRSLPSPSQQGLLNLSTCPSRMAWPFEPGWL